MKNRLREIRESNKISRRDLSIASGVSERTIYCIEKKNMVPTSQNALKLSEALEVTVNDILILEEKDYDCSKQKNEK